MTIARALADSYLADRRATFPPDARVSDFVHTLELTLASPALIREYLELLDQKLDRVTPRSREFAESEWDSLMNDGLHWLPADRVALLAIDRGALSALHLAVYEEWSDFWWQRAKEAHPDERSAAIAERNPQHLAEPVAEEYLMSLEAGLPLGSSSAELSTPTSAFHNVAVPEAQVIWLAGKPVSLSVSITLDSRPSAQQVSVNLRSLPLTSKVVCNAWLLTNNFQIQSGVRAAGNLEFETPITFQPLYLTVDYRSAERDLVLVVALDGSAVPREQLVRAIKAAAATLAVSDSKRSEALLKVCDL
jgi:hypothetical protein